jgi:hypothetical protein
MKTRSLLVLSILIGGLSFFLPTLFAESQYELKWQIIGNLSISPEAPMQEANLLSYVGQATVDSGNGYYDLESGVIAIYFYEGSTKLFVRFFAEGLIEISWPLNSNEMILEKTDSLTNPSWKPVPTPPNRAGGHYVVTLVDEGVGFLRLRRTNASSAANPSIGAN